MEKKATCWILAAIVSGVVCACGNGRQDAAVALDAARLSVSDARKAGAESSSPSRLAEAAAALSTAEGHFQRRNYAEAQSSAQKARDTALLAEKEAKAKSKAPKKAARAKRRAKK